MTLITLSPDAKWTAARTKARCEKQVKIYCERHDITCYLPLRRQARRYQRRMVETYLPMFAGYIFVQVNEPEYDVLQKCPKVVSVLPIHQSQEKQLVEDLRDIQILEKTADQHELVVRPELIAGQTVSFSTGPFQGLNGIVQRRQQTARVTVNVEMLGQSVSIDVDIGEVMVVDD